jgi:hypothetical protein
VSLVRAGGRGGERSSALEQPERIRGAWERDGLDLAVLAVDVGLVTNGTARRWLRLLEEARDRRFSRPTRSGCYCDAVEGVALWPFRL